MEKLFEVSDGYYYEVRVNDANVIDYLRDAGERYGDGIGRMVPIITANITREDNGYEFSLYLTLDGMEGNRMFFCGSLSEEECSTPDEMKKNVLMYIDANLQTEEWLEILPDWYAVAGIAYERPLSMY